MRKTLISHRGNLNGPLPKEENNPGYIDRAIRRGFQVEIDLWKEGDKLFLGHDAPTYITDMDWLIKRQDVLWIHCKNIESLEYMSRWYLNYFWHEGDKYTLTSKLWVWAYPNQKTSTKYNRTVAVLPEWEDTDVSEFAGICSDYIERYND